MLKNTVNKIYGRHTTRSTYDLSVRTEVGRKSTTKCTQKLTHLTYLVLKMNAACTTESSATFPHSQCVILNNGINSRPDRNVSQ
jgi:hypothetical protein